MAVPWCKGKAIRLHYQKTRDKGQYQPSKGRGFRVQNREFDVSDIDH